MTGEQPQELRKMAIEQTRQTAQTVTACLSLDKMTTVALMGGRARVKEQLAQEETAYEKKIAPLLAAVQKLEGAIVDKMDANGDTQVKNQYGTAYFTNPESMKVIDRDIFFAWVVDNGAYDVLTSAISKDAVRERGVYPPGISVSRIRKLCIRKS